MALANGQKWVSRNRSSATGLSRFSKPMRVSVASLLLAGYLVLLLYAHNLFGLNGFDLLPFSCVAVLFVWRAVSRHEIAALLSIYLVACFATAISLLRFPSVLPEAVKSLATFAVALVSGYVGLVTTKSLSRKSISRVCLGFVLVINSLAILELAFPPLRSASRALSVMQYQGAGGGIDFFEANVQRDLTMHGGLVRPVVGSQEPSWVGTTLAFALTGWNMTRRPSRQGAFNFLCLAFTSFVIVRSPAFVMMLMGGNWLFFVKLIPDRSAAGFVLKGIAIVAGIVGVWLIGERIDKVWNGDEGSFNERIRLPYEFTKIALWETSGLGLGFIGKPAEAGNESLTDFFPMVVAAVKRANCEGLLYVYRDGYDLSAGHSPLLTHWFYHGIPLGILSVLIWIHFLQVRHRGFVIVFFISLTIVSWCGSGYEAVRFWTFNLILLGFMSHQSKPGQDIHDREQLIYGQH